MLKMRGKTWCSMGSLLLVVLLMSACAGHNGLTVLLDGQPPRQIDSHDDSLLPDGLENYRVEVGDRLSFEATFQSTPGEHFVLDLGDEIAVSFNFGRDEYKVMAGDTLRVNFLTEPDMDFEVIVRPDGRITVPGIGELAASGKTPRSLAASVSASYRQFKEVPRCTVTLVQPDPFAIQTMAGEFVVLPDGNVYIPILGRFHAAGLSPERFAQLLAMTASEHFSGHIESTVVPNKVTGKQDVIFRKEVEVGPLGSILLPRIGEVPAAGRELSDLRAEVVSRLEELFSHPIQGRAILYGVGEQSCLCQWPGGTARQLSHYERVDHVASHHAGWGRDRRRKSGRGCCCASWA